MPETLGGTHFGSTMEVKSVGTFPVILVKLVTPPLPPKTKLNFEQNFLGAKTLLGGGGRGSGEVGYEGMNLEPIKKIVVGSRVLSNNNLEGFFTQSQVLLSSIVASFSFLKWRRSQVDRHHTFTVWFKLSSQHSDKSGFPSSCNIKTILL